MTDPQAPSRRHAAGFSLVELVMVIVIIAVMGALAVPRFANASANRRAEAAARRVVADLSYAQTIARAKSDTYTARFPGDQTLVLIGPDGLAVSSTDYAAAPFEATIAVALDIGGTDLGFNGFGYPDTGGAITITAGNANPVVLDLDPATGGVSRR